MTVLLKISLHLHELKGGFKVFYWIHLNAEELDPHDKTYDAFDYIRALFLLPKLLQLGDKLLPYCGKPKRQK